MFCEIKDVYSWFRFSRDDITRKYLNMMAKYLKNNSSGEAANSWGYYEDFDDVHGTHRDVVVPPNLLESSLNESLEMVLDGESGNRNSTLPPKSKRPRCEVLKMLRNEHH